MNRSTLYDRDVQVVGRDLELVPLGDIQTGYFGDLATLTGSESIKESLRRRLQTPLNGYKRWVQTGDGLIEVDSTYGNRAYNYLSSPLVLSKSLDIEQAILDCAEGETRIEVLSVSIKGTSLNSIQIELVYRIRSNEELESLNLTLERLR